MRPFLAVFMISLCTVLAACHRSRNAHPAAAARPIPPLPIVKAEDVPPPPHPTVVLEKGMVLSHVAAEAYGHEKFSGMLTRFNQIADPARLPIGTVIRTPSIPDLFKTAGLDAKYQPAINALAMAVHDFYAVLPQYRALREKSSAAGKPAKLTLPAAMKTQLDHIADAAVAAAAVFASAAPPHKAPMATVMQFRQAAAQVRQLASGVVDHADNDDEMVGQRFGLGMTNALIWVQQSYQ